MANSEQLREQLAEEEAWLRRLDECYETFDDLKLRMSWDKKEIGESLALADAAVRLLWRRQRQQAGRCTEIRRQLEGEKGGGE